uniref:ABM domain-containing protein n=1 Tax=Attheya septentrionalis TaxID=420275 RepID=A0A7S2U695_9STRA
MRSCLLVTALVSSLAGTALCFSGSTLPNQRTTSLSSSSVSVSSVVKDDDVQLELTEKGLLKRDRYVATNRFAVRAGKEAKFEARWANRQSRLATLDGFRYFHLMRRVTLNDDGSGINTYQPGEAKEEKMGNYVSFTIWERKSDFSAWRTGDAFKEAHGGTSIGAFMSTMINSALVLKGPPRPAFYDGLLMQSVPPTSIPETENGWRTNLVADGVTNLPAECFVACNQFFVPTENGPAFEKRWADRESKLAECEGFVAFGMMRRDGTAKGHGTSPMGMDEPTYMSTTIWSDRAAFESWKNGNAFRQSHGTNKDDDAAKEKKPAAPAPLWSKPPSPIFYEGTLVITKEEGP